MPIIRLAPAILQPSMAARPTAPRPHMAQLAPECTLAVFKAAPSPVLTPQPSRQVRSGLAASSTYNAQGKICYIGVNQKYKENITTILIKVCFVKLEIRNKQ